jgi:glycosyltransferase involved in cell wall biosynthesis
MERRRKPHVLFDHSRWQMAQARWPSLPAVTMIHGNAALEPHSRNRVFCSIAHGRWHGVENPVALLNGIEPTDFTVGPPMASRREALWLGRIMPYKRPHLAIDLCQRAGVPITVAGPAADADYFAREVRPRLQPEGWGRYVGEVAGAERLRLLSEACCLVFTSEAQEPAGIVMHEAMASGTPVYAFAHGANREFVIDARTGYLCSSEESFEATLRLHGWQRIDPAACRQHVEEHLSIGAMATKAEAMLAQAADGATW